MTVFRSCRAARQGFTLVEVLVATLLIVIIFLGWLQIANFQAIRKESLRRLALEKAAGYLDVMTDLRPATTGQYQIVFNGSTYTNVPVPPDFALPLFTNANEVSSSPGYVLKVLSNADLISEADVNHSGWPDNVGFAPPQETYWAIIELYNGTNKLDRPFSRMSVLYASN